MQYRYKAIKFNPDDHDVIKELAEEIQEERGTPNAYLPPVVMEAIKFFKEHRNDTMKGKDNV